MATDNAATPAAPTRKLPNEIRIVSHSSLFYWWPVWVVGFVMAIISYLPPHYQMVPVPSGTKAGTLTKSTEISWTDGSTIKKVPAETPVWYAPPDTNKNRIRQPGVTVSTSSRPGVVFAFVLLIVITITNIQMRGLWSLIVVVVIVALVVILALAGAWETIFEWFTFLDIRISTGGYVVISTVLLVIWLVVLLIFDPQRYMIFTPGQFKVRLEIGEGVTAYDTRGMTVKKERSDFFRHWILGMGSGDLIVKTTGAQAHQFDLPNVLFLNQKVSLIQEMITTHKETN